MLLSALILKRNNDKKGHLTFQKGHLRVGGGASAPQAPRQVRY